MISLISRKKWEEKSSNNEASTMLVFSQICFFRFLLFVFSLELRLLLNSLLLSSTISLHPPDFLPRRKFSCVEIALKLVNIVNRENMNKNIIICIARNNIRPTGIYKNTEQFKKFSAISFEWKAQLYSKLNYWKQIVY